MYDWLSLRWIWTESCESLWAVIVRLFCSHGRHELFFIVQEICLGPVEARVCRDHKVGWPSSFVSKNIAENYFVA